MDQRQFPLEIKHLDDATGQFAGYLSVFNVVDLGRDVVEPGAFTKTLGESLARKDAAGSRYLMPVLWHHDQADPIGGFTAMREDQHGLWVEAELDLDTEPGRRAYSGLKKGYIRGLSIGYKAIRDAYTGGARRLIEVALFEGSIATLPMNVDANVVAVKADTGRPVQQPAQEEKTTLDFNTIQQQNAAWRYQQELDDLTDDLMAATCAILQDATIPDPMPAITETLTQFSTAYLAWAQAAIASGGFRLYGDYRTVDPGVAPAAVETMSARTVEAKAGRRLSQATMDQMAKGLQLMAEARKSLSSAHSHYKGLMAAAPDPDADADPDAGTDNGEPVAADGKTATVPAPDFSPLLADIDAFRAALKTPA